MSFVLKMKNITKAFPGVIALDDVSLELKHGEVLALLGENGAGKSTMIKILGGALNADKGQIILEEKELNNLRPSDMIEQGIAVMHQELNYLDDLSIAENIFLGHLPVNKLGHVNYSKLKNNTKRLLKLVGLDKDPFTEVSLLSIAEKQMMEIAKVLSKENCRVLVMDEPTSALNEAEVDILFGLIKDLASKNISIIYISHKIEEIFKISNRIQVLRDGKSVGVLNTRKTTSSELVTLMVGRNIENMYSKIDISKGKAILEIENLFGDNTKDISFKVHEGEVVGLFGLMGAGRTEIVESIFGKRKVQSGVIKIDGKIMSTRSPQHAIKSGIAYLPRERKSDGLVLTETIMHNMTLVYLDRLMSFLHLNIREEKKITKEWISRLRINTPTMHNPIISLSGGNQQKVVLGKWLLNKPRIILLNEPTRGIDIGAKAEIYKLIEQICENGVAVLLISSETPEIMGISDRIIVIREGRIEKEFMRMEFDQEKIMHYAVKGGLP